MGLTLRDIRDLTPIEETLALLRRARSSFESAGVQVQTIRIATSPLIARMSAAERERALDDLCALDRLLQEHGVSASIGPCSGTSADDAELAPWIAELLRVTSRLCCSIQVAAVTSGAHRKSARLAAEAMCAIARVTPEGAGNFRFAAAACVPPGTPFYPVAFHEGDEAISIGLESASIVARALADAADDDQATARLRDMMNSTLSEIERIGTSVAEQERCAYVGIDASPAPGLDHSIGAAVEAFTKRPFGEPGTLDACAAITSALRELTVKTCGYSGLMLPVLEDRVLAQRASEGCFGLRDLLLFSSVCGTGLDVVPLPGDTPVDVVERIVRDTAALATRWSKPLSARLYLIPGKRAGELATFSNAELTDCRVMSA